MHFTHATDHELLIHIQQGDEQAFNELFHRYYRFLCHQAYKRLPSNEVVEEIVQDVFVNLWLKAHLLDVNGNVKAYLLATLRNKILFVLRTEATRAYYREKIQKKLGQSVEESPFSQLYLREMESEIDDAIAQLSPQCREAFLLSRDAHLSYREIAERMHISINTVEKHIGKALRILRSRLSKYAHLFF